MNNEDYIRVADGYLEVRKKLGPGRPSASGKTLVVFTTGGFVDAEGAEVRVNITATKRR